MRLGKIMPPYLLTLAALFSLFTSQVSATLMSADDPQFGAGSLTVDSSTNLAWLDLSITEGNPFNEVSSQLDSGGTYSGFRFASPEEVFRLFEEAHIPDINDPGISGQQGTLVKGARFDLFPNHLRATSPNNLQLWMFRCIEKIDSLLESFIHYQCIILADSSENREVCLGIQAGDAACHDNAPEYGAQRGSECV